MGHALELPEPDARRIEGPGFAGRLRGAAIVCPLLVVDGGRDVIPA